jgi:hypothetical protein
MAIENVAKTLDAPATTPRLEDARTFLVQHASILLFSLVVLAAGWTLLHYDLTQQPIPEDTTYHIYAAQQMLEGHPIYRDVAIIKAPLADFLTLFALPIGRVLQLADTLAARLIFLLVALLTIGVTYLAGRELFGSHLVGVVAAVLVAGNNFYDIRAVTGPEPKSLVILFTFAAFILIARRRWDWAGICATLATLAWQPAAMVVALALGAALVAPWFDPKPPAWNTRARWMPLLRVVGGSILPFLPLILYLALNDALVPAWEATIGANVSYMNTHTLQTPLGDLLEYNLHWLSNDINTYCVAAAERWQLAVGALGFVGMLAGEGIVAWRRKCLPLNLERTPFLLYTLGFAAFTLIDFNFCPDLFPLLPALALAIGWLVGKVAEGASALVARPASPRLAAPTAMLFGAGAVLIIAGVGLLDARDYHIVGITYRDQQNLVGEATKHLRGNGRILSFGNAIILVELQRENASKIIHFGPKSGEGVLEYEPNGLDGLLTALDQNPPQLISLARTTRQNWNQDFFDWLKARYRLVWDDKYNAVRLYVLRKRAQ